MRFLDCPAWLDNDGAVRSGLPAEARLRSYRKRPVQVTSHGQPVGRQCTRPDRLPPGDITRTRQPALQIIPLGAAWKAMQTGPGQRQIGGYLRGDVDQR
jgi:hypothetical protein